MKPPHGRPTDDLLLRALRQPRTLPALAEREWDVLVRQARRARLLGRLAGLIEQAGVSDRIPPAPRAHLQAARLWVTAQQSEALREIGHVVHALEPLGVPVILLKGAAYLSANLPAALGRSFMDVDILVPRSCLPQVEARLMLHGWATTHHDAYDQRYYRQWMHELPPLRHHRRQTVLDVHHAILPRTGRLKPDTGKLIEAAVPIPGRPALRTLAAEDIVLHSMAHLFHNDDLTHALRDLSDIDLLLRQSGACEPFWQRLVERGRELDLERPLYYGLRCANLMLHTPVPEEILAPDCLSAPPWPSNRWMDALWRRTLSACAAPRPDVRATASLLLLHARAHWLRMPVWLLAAHLCVKAAGKLRSVRA